MHTHPSLFSSSAPVSSPSGAGGAHLVPVSSRAYQRWLRSAIVYYCPSPGFQVYWLPCGCFLWVHYSGLRFLSELPF